MERIDFIELIRQGFETHPIQVKSPKIYFRDSGILHLSKEILLLVD